MKDPTHFVLTLGLALTVVLFVATSVIRLLGARETLVEVTDPTDPEGTLRKIALPPVLPEGRVPVWFYHPLDLIGAAFVLFVFCGMLFLPPGSKPQPEAQSLKAEALIANIGFQVILASIMMCLVFWRVNISTWLGLRWKDWHWVFLIAPGSVFAMWILFSVLHYSGYMKWMESLGVETVQDTVVLLQKCQNPLILGLMAFTAMIAAPICEEVVFRGYLYPVLKRFSGPWVAGICSAFIFAAAHGNLTALPPLFILGTLLAFLYEKTGSIWAPIAVHFTFNSATVIIQMAVRYFDIPIDPNL